MLRTINSICQALDLAITDLEKFREVCSGEMLGARQISTAAQLVIIIVGILPPV